MISILSFVGWSVLYLLGGMAGAALVMGIVLSPWLIRNWLLTREIRAIDDPLPGHEPGRIKASRRACRGLYRDVVLLLVVNADREDAS